VSFVPFPENGRPLLLLAPMRDVTDLPFWRIMHRYGGPDVYFTEFFRVHSTSKPERHILECIRANPARAPVIAQIMGRDIPGLIHSAQALDRENIAAIDLNCGCPAPIVCRKKSGGGLLRDLPQLDRILESLPPAMSLPLTVKTRIGFSDPSEFDSILEILACHPIAALTVHARTVRQMYLPPIHLDCVRRAARSMQCPVIANGDIWSALDARQTIEQTGARGLMIGRGAIRNPWIWNQIRAEWEGAIPPAPTLCDARAYVEALYHETRTPLLSEKLHVAKMKKYMNFIALGIGPDEAFLKRIRRVETEAEFFAICDAYLNSEEMFAAIPR
jgi:tRNA-dihydrouridine synthase